MTKSITYYDARILLDIIATIGLAVLLGFALYRLNQLKPMQKITRVTIGIVFACWALATVATTTLYSYDSIREQRDFFKQSIEVQRQAEQGL